ncbi:MAG: galactokinase family protein [Cytophagales bacterium]|nr:galactokinase family protein [Cytophagales bacterium]
MLSISDLKSKVSSDHSTDIFQNLYGTQQVLPQRQRYLQLIHLFENMFAVQNKAAFYSTPGRTEIGGNHTDHNAGRVLAAAVSLDMVALAEPTNNGIIHIISEGYDAIIININDLSKNDNEKFTSTSIIRGICSRFIQLGYKIGGFNAVLSGQVPKGSGLSSSAAFEVLIVSVLNDMYNSNEIDPVTAAKISQYAENEYFGKPCGLMDQTTCSVGGMVAIDFKDFNNPVVKKMQSNLTQSGYSLVIVNTGGNHADLNDDYIALEHEMKSVASYFDKNVLRHVTLEQLFANIKPIRAKHGDRAVLRALHFLQDDRRVAAQVVAVESNNLQEFFKLVIESGDSSWKYCQNCYSVKHPEEQGIPTALIIASHILAGDGAWRVHGGGFAGTIQAFVPTARVDLFVQNMDQVFDKGCCYIVQIRNEGAVNVKF